MDGLHLLAAPEKILLEGQGKADLLKIVRIHGIDPYASVHAPYHRFSLLVLHFYKKRSGSRRVASGQSGADDHIPHDNGRFILIKAVCFIRNDGKSRVAHIRLRAVTPFLILSGQPYLCSRQLL